MKPHFSVVIPTFNRADKLRRTIDSVLAQSFVDFELLVMDDGSTDGTKAVVDGLHDPRIRYEWAPNSGGPATPRNRGIDAAAADWVSFLDADDLWHREKLAQVAKCIEQCPGADLICHDVTTSIEASGVKFTSRCGPFERDLYRVMLTEGNQVITSAATVRREFLNRHGLRFNTSPDYVIVEDYDLWLRIALLDGKFCRIGETLGVYVIEGGNISADLSRFNRNHMTLLKAHVFHLQTFDQDKDRLWRQITSHLKLDRARALFGEKHFVLGLQSLVRGFQGAPTTSISYIGSKFARLIRKYVA